MDKSHTPSAQVRVKATKNN